MNKVKYILSFLPAILIAYSAKAQTLGLGTADLNPPSRVVANIMGYLMIISFIIAIIFVVQRFSNLRKLKKTSGDKSIIERKVHRANLIIIFGFLVAFFAFIGFSMAISYESVLP
jgi:uncharacterized membrane protein